MSDKIILIIKYQEEGKEEDDIEHINTEHKAINKKYTKIQNSKVYLSESDNNKSNY